MNVTVFVILMFVMLLLMIGAKLNEIHDTLNEILKELKRK